MQELKYLDIWKGNFNMTIFLLMTSTLIDIFLFYFFMKRFAECKKNKLIIGFFGVFIPNLGINISHFISLSESTLTLLNLISYILFIAFLTHNIKLPMIDKFYFGGIYVLITLLSESITALELTQLLNYDLDKIPLVIDGTIPTFATKTVLIICAIILLKKDFFRTRKASKLIVCLVPLTSLFVLSCYMFLYFIIEIPIENTILTLLLIFEISFLNLGFLILYNRMKKENRTDLEYQKLEFNLIKQKKELTNAIASQEQLQSMRHDFKNTVLILASHIENKKYTDAMNFILTIQSQISELDNNSLEVYTPNKELNYLLSHKIYFAKNHGIVTQVNCLIPEELNLENDIIIVLFGNLLDNAINACLEIDKSCFKKIDLKIKYFDQSLFINIKNTIDTNHSEIPNEGIGIKNIKKTVRENSGIYEQFIENDYYCVKIILWDFN